MKSPKNLRDVSGLGPASHELEHEKELVSQVAVELKRRRREAGIKYFTPNRPQLKALKSPARIIAYVGGNRGGKSTAGAAFLTGHMTEIYPSCECHGEWFNETKRISTRPLKALIVATSFQKIEEVIEPKLVSLMPKELIQNIKRGGMNYLRQMILKDGSRISCLSGDQDEMEFESADWDIAWIDEPLSRSRFTAITRGLLDRKGIMILTFTPKIEPWMKETFLDTADGKYIDVIEADTYENTEDIHGNAILAKEEIEAWERTLPEDERDYRIHGKFFFMKGIVYKEFGDAHIADFDYVDEARKRPAEDEVKQLPVICVLDPHDRLPHHVIWAYIDPTDDVFIDYELITHCELDELAKKIITVEKQRGYKMRKRLIDPNFGRRPSKPGGSRSVIQELGANKCVFYEANDNIELGHMLVRDYLHWDTAKPTTAVNKPKLFFSKSRVPQTIRSIRNYQYGEWKGASKDERDPKERFKDKDTHGADCIRYLIISRPLFKSLYSVREYELDEQPY